MDLNNVNIDKLRIVEAIVRSGSVREAARLLHVTPGAVSSTLKGIESQIGQAFFVRAGRRMVPTAAAERVLETLSPFLASLENALYDITAGSTGTLMGKIRLGAPSQFGTSRVIPAIGSFCGEHPRVEFIVRFGEPSALIEGLINGRHDFVICDDGPYLSRYPQVASKPIATEELVLACSKNYFRDHVRKAPTLTDLTGLRHIAYNETQEDLEKWYRFHFGRSRKTHASIVIDHVSGVIAAIRASLGVGMVPLHLIEKDVVAGEIKIIPTKKKRLTSQILILQLRDKVPGRAEKEFLAFLATRMAKNGSRGTGK